MVYFVALFPIPYSLGGGGGGGGGGWWGGGWLWFFLNFGVWCFFFFFLFVVFFLFGLVGGGGGGGAGGGGGGGGGGGLLEGSVRVLYLTSLGIESYCSSDLIGPVTSGSFYQMDWCGWGNVHMASDLSLLSPSSFFFCYGFVNAAYTALALKHCKYLGPCFINFHLTINCGIYCLTRHT